MAKSKKDGNWKRKTGLSIKDAMNMDTESKEKRHKKGKKPYVSPQNVSRETLLGT